MRLEHSSGRISSENPHPDLAEGEWSGVQEIPFAEIRILWVDDYWDGPLSGIAEWRGGRYRFELMDRSTLDEDGRPRHYRLIALSLDQIREEERWQELFCTHVSTTFDYTGRPPHCAPEAEHPKFYQPYSERTAPDYSGNEVVGWFQL